MKTPKLTPSDAEEIRKTYAAGGISQKQLAHKYGIDPTYVSNIITKNLMPREPGQPLSDLTGSKFGRLTVLGYASAIDKNGSTIWNCRCECGTEKAISRGPLTSGGTRSCGCLNRESRKVGYKLTHCPKGHELVEPNLILVRGVRRCDTCRTAYMNEWRRKRRELRIGMEDKSQKVTDADVKAIRIAYADGAATKQELVANYGLCLDTVRSIINGRHRPRAGGPITAPRTPKLTTEAVKAIREEYANSSISLVGLAAKYGVSGGAISLIFRGKNWKSVGGPTPPSREIRRERETVTWFQAAFLKPIDPKRLLSKADAARIFGISVGGGQ